jgi:ubiquinone/menaquinone biosynthesis C-methylase UbiE
MEKAMKVPIDPKKARGIYDSLSQIYDYLTLYEGGAKRRGLDAAGIEPGHRRVLEVGFGTGKILGKILEKNAGGETCGMELSPRMLRKARRRIAKNDASEGSHLLVADARHIPFRGGHFEIVFNSYMLDLMDYPVICAVLQEIKRVLEPGGHLVLVGLSKGEGWRSNMKAYEWLYGVSPSIFAGCRPLLLEPMVKDAGFCNIRREFLLAGRIMPSEIIYCEKPVG